MNIIFVFLDRIFYVSILIRISYEYNMKCFRKSNFTVHQHYNSPQIFFMTSLKREWEAENRIRINSSQVWVWCRPTIFFIQVCNVSNLKITRILCFQQFIQGIQYLRKIVSSTRSDWADVSSRLDLWYLPLLVWTRCPRTAP